MGRPRKQQTISPEIILDKVEKCFVGLRWQDISMGQVAKKIKIKPPSLYHHFEGIEDLRRQLTLRSLQHFYDFLKNETNKGLDKNKLELFAHAYRSFAHQYPLYFDCAQFGISSQDDDLMQAAEQVVYLAAETLKIYKIAPIKITHVIRILRSSLNGFIELEMNAGFQMTEDVNKTFAELITFLKAGLKEYSD